MIGSQMQKVLKALKEEIISDVNDMIIAIIKPELAKIKKAAIAAAVKKIEETYDIED